MEPRHLKSSLDTKTNLQYCSTRGTHLNWMFSTGASVKSDTHSMLRICWTCAPPSITGSTGLACTFSCGDGSQGHDKDTWRRVRVSNNRAPQLLTTSILWLDRNWNYSRVKRRTKMWRSSNKLDNQSAMERIWVMSVSWLATDEEKLRNWVDVLLP